MPLPALHTYSTVHNTPQPLTASVDVWCVYYVQCVCVCTAVENEGSLPLHHSYNIAQPYPQVPSFWYGPYPQYNIVQHVSNIIIVLYKSSLIIIIITTPQVSIGHTCGKTWFAVHRPRLEISCFLFISPGACVRVCSCQPMTLWWMLTRSTCPHQSQLQTSLMTVWTPSRLSRTQWRP